MLSFRSGPPIDRGWAWLVVLSAFMHLFIMIGLAKSSGIIFVELIEKYQGSASSASAMVALQTGVSLFFAPVITAAVEMFNCRQVCFAGSFMFASAFFVASFLDSLEEIAITFGILAGLGYGCCLTPTPVIVGRYFDKKRSLANGLAFSGTGLGNVVMPIFVYHLIDKYYLHGAMLILAAFSLQTSVFASLYRPLTLYEPWRQKLVAKKSSASSKGVGVVVDGEFVVNGVANDRSRLDRTNGGVSSPKIKKLPENRKNDRNASVTDKLIPKLARIDELNHEVDVVSSNDADDLENLASASDRFDDDDDERTSSIRGSVLDLTIVSSLQDIPRCLLEQCKQDECKADECKADECKEDGRRQSGRWTNAARKLAIRICYVKNDRGELNHVLSIELLKNVEFLLSMLGVVVFLNAFFISMIVPPHCADLNMTKADAALMLSIQGGADTTGRLFTAFVGDRPFFRPHRRLALAAYAALVAACLAAMPLAPTFASFALALTVFSFAFGAFVALNPVVVTDIVGVRRLAGAWGLQLFFEGFTLTLSPLVIGALRDSTGSYRASFWYLALGCLLASISISASRFWSRRRKIRDNRKN